MIRIETIWRMTVRTALLALPAVPVLLIGVDGDVAFAQAMMRSPSISVPSRIPDFDRMPRINPNIAGRAINGGGTDGLKVRSDCTAAYRDSSGNCADQPITSADRNGRKGSDKSGRGTSSATPLNSLSATNDIVAEIDSALSEAQTDEMARRHGLRRVESQNFPLIGATIGLFRVTGRKTVETARRELALEASVRSVQSNFRFVLQDQLADLKEGDPAQYALAKLRLPQAHTLARGLNVTVAVIDSGIDLKHPEFAGVAITSFDALGSTEGPHAHGTGVAGALVSHARLMGSAPAAQLLAIRAFGVSGKSAESTSYVVLKALEFAAAHGAQVLNMSFAGPKDPLIERSLSALAKRNIVMVAAAGNAGPKSPPLYPAADVNVIAVSATDAQDKLFAASNRGSYIAIAAPGVDIFLPAPDDKYQMTSGTSFSSAYISGLVALMLERNPALRPAEVRTILMNTARDLGPPGRDDLFGAGEGDAFAAVSAIVVSPAPVAVSEKQAVSAIASEPVVSSARAEASPMAATATEKPAIGDHQPEPSPSKP